MCVSIDTCTVVCYGTYMYILDVYVFVCVYMLCVVYEYMLCVCISTCICVHAKRDHRLTFVKHVKLSKHKQKGRESEREREREREKERECVRDLNIDRGRKRERVRGRERETHLCIMQMCAHMCEHSKYKAPVRQAGWFWEKLSETAATCR
jgi:hypothetical protein